MAGDDRPWQSPAAAGGPPLLGGVVVNEASGLFHSAIWERAPLPGGAEGMARRYRLASVQSVGEISVERARADLRARGVPDSGVSFGWSGDPAALVGQFDWFARGPGGVRMEGG